MTYYEHALISVRKFKSPELFQDFLVIHKFIDSSKFLYTNFKHRMLLHHTYGAELAIQKFGDYVGNGILVRDIVFEHCREDHKRIPTLNDWIVGANLLVSVPELKTMIDDSLKTGKCTWLDSVSFKERWMYTPDIREINWLKSEERFKLEKTIKNKHNGNI